LIPASKSEDHIHPDQAEPRGGGEEVFVDGVDFLEAVLPHYIRPAGSLRLAISAALRFGGGSEMEGIGGAEGGGGRGGGEDGLR
jgi:hypothetical protein